MRLVGRAVAGVVGTGVAIFAGAGAMDDDTTRSETGAIVEAGGLGAFVMQIGDCFNEPDGDQVVSVEGLPCTSPHDAEVFALWDLPFASLPTDDEAVLDTALNGCYSYFEGYVGATYESSSLDIWVFTPTPESWENGDREVLCYVYDFAGNKLSQVARDSRL